MTTEQSQRVVRVDSRRAWVECTHCTEVQCVDRDEDGGAAIEQYPCHECGEMLCENCKVICEFCGARHCADHMKNFEGMNLCPVCVRIQEDIAFCIKEEKERVGVTK